MIINKLLIKTIAPIPKIDRYQKYLFIAPHPDDIEIAVGSTVAKLCGEGKEVNFLICTDGRYGTEDNNLSPEELVEIRRKEQLESAKILGVNHVDFLPYHDGGNYSETSLRCDIAKIIAKFKPDVVVCPDHKLYPECHPDHLIVGEAASRAYFMCSNYHMMKENGCDETANPQVLAFYFTGKPNSYVKIKKKDFEKNMKAFNCFKSQFLAPDSGKSLMLYMKIKVKINGIRCVRLRADAFRAMNNLHIHCCSEAE